MNMLVDQFKLTYFINQFFFKELLGHNLECYKYINIYLNLVFQVESIEKNIMLIKYIHHK